MARQKFILAIIIFAIASILIGIFFNREQRIKAEKRIKNTIEQINRQTIATAPTSFKEASGEAIAGFNEMASQGFVVTYIQKEDVYKIDLAGRDIEKEKKAAEEFLLDNVFKTRDLAVVCRIKVSFVDLSAVLKIDEFLAQQIPKGKELSPEEREERMEAAEKMYQEIGGAKVISEKLSICP